MTRKDGFKSVNYALLVPVLVKAIKRQRAMIADLQAQLKGLPRSSLQAGAESNGFKQS